MAKKLLVLSDSHGHLGLISDALRLELQGVDFVVHLGDFWFDMKPFIREIKNSGKEIIIIRGNVDSMRGDSTTAFIPEIEFLEFEGRKVMFTHGHVFEVHNGLEKLKYASASNKCEVVIFGHTHQPMAREVNGVFFFNPGALRDGVYGVVSIGEAISYKHYRLKNLP